MKKEEEYFRKAAGGSLFLHLLVLGLVLFGKFEFLRNDNVAMDVEIAGEGVLENIQYDTNENIEEPTSEIPAESSEVPSMVDDTLPQNPESEQIPLEPEKEPEPMEETPQEQLSEPEQISPPDEEVIQEESTPNIDEELLRKQQEEEAQKQAELEKQKQEELDRQRQEEEARRQEELEKRKQEEEQEAEKKRREEEARKKREELKKKKEDERKNRKKKLSEILKKSKEKKKKMELAKLKNKQRNDLMSTLNDLEKTQRTISRRRRASSGTGRRGNGAGSSGNGLGAGNSGDLISSQIYPHWIIPAGIKNSENLNVELHIEVNDNGEVVPSSVKVIDTNRYATDEVFRAVVDSAMRAVLAASPLKIPPDKIDMFKSCRVRFNVKEALGE